MKQFDSFGLDTSNECLWQNGVQIALPPKPFAVLRYLVENPGRLVTHDELLDALWPETFVQPQVLRTYMLDLRKVLGDDAKQPRFIQTIPKRGFSFIAHITEREGKVTAPRAGAAAEQPAERAIVDREDETARLEAAARLAAQGQRQVVFVSGETGIGKTALVDHFCRRALSLFPAAVAHGQCVRGLGGREEYYPVMEALGQLCASPDGEAACAILARMAPAWLAALGREPAATAQSTGRSAPPDRLLSDLCAALEELAAEKPLILVFEDLHWADDSTLALVSALARRRARARLAVLATCRLHGAELDHPLKELKQDLLIRRLCAEIVLAPLTRAAIKELVRKKLGQDELPAGLSSFVHQRHPRPSHFAALSGARRLGRGSEVGAARGVRGDGSGGARRAGADDRT